MALFFNQPKKINDERSSKRAGFENAKLRPHSVVLSRLPAGESPPNLSRSAASRRNPLVCPEATCDQQPDEQPGGARPEHPLQTIQPFDRSRL